MQLTNAELRALQHTRARMQDLVDHDNTLALEGGQAFIDDLVKLIKEATIKEN
jgi:hypothetical protein